MAAADRRRGGEQSGSLDVRGFRVTITIRDGAESSSGSIGNDSGSQVSVAFRVRSVRLRVRSERT